MNFINLITLKTFYYLSFGVTQNSVKYFFIRILVCESIAGIAPNVGAIIGISNH